MMSGAQMTAVGFYHDGEHVCRRCGREAIGELTVDRAEHGLGKLPDGWECFYGWEADESARDHAEDCDCGGGCWCRECGARIDSLEGILG
jgi:hypothetical protein